MKQLNFLEDLFRSLVRRKTAIEPESRNPIRCSGVPFCRANLALHLLLELKERNISFMQDFYFGQGKAMHSTIQLWLARAGALYGVYICKSGECIGKSIFRQKGIGPFTCPQCKKEMVYDEIEVKTPEGLIGHTDGLIPYKDGYIVLELKSIGAKRLDKDELPYEHNVLQANNYGVIFEKYYKLKIYGVVIVYWARDSHLNYKFFLLPKLDYKKYKATIKDVIEVRAAMKTGNFSKVTGVCNNNIEASDCVFKGLCLMGSLEKHLIHYWNLTK